MRNWTSPLSQDNTNMYDIPEAVKALRELAAKMPTRSSSYILSALATELEYGSMEAVDQLSEYIEEFLLPDE